MIDHVMMGVLLTCVANDRYSSTVVTVVISPAAVFTKIDAGFHPIALNVIQTTICFALAVQFVYILSSE